MTTKEKFLSALAYTAEICFLAILALIYWRLVTYRGFPPPPAILGRLISADGEKALRLMLGDCFIWLFMVDALAFVVTKGWKRRQGDPSQNT